MDSVGDTPCRVGCPIRRSRDQRSLASPPGFSQRATSFIASQCQGIHQMPLPKRLIAQPVACRDKPRLRPVSHEDTLLLGGRQRTDNGRRIVRGPLEAAQSLPLHSVKQHGPWSPAPSANLELLPILAHPLPAQHRCACRAVPLRGTGGRGERDRTVDLVLAKQALSRLSYAPRDALGPLMGSTTQLVGQGGLEPPTSRLSSARSNQLSY